MIKLTYELSDTERLYIHEREQAIMSNVPFKPSDKLLLGMLAWKRGKDSDSNSHNTP